MSRRFGFQPARDRRLRGEGRPPRYRRLLLLRPATHQFWRRVARHPGRLARAARSAVAGRCQYHRRDSLRRLLSMVSPTGGCQRPQRLGSRTAGDTGHAHGGGPARARTTLRGDYELPLVIKYRTRKPDNIRLYNIWPQEAF